MPLKKWYMRIVFYLIDMSVSNSWLVYRRSNPEYMPLRDFKLRIAATLMKSTTKRRGRPSLDIPTPKRRNHPTVPIPDVEERYDCYNHWPAHNTEKKRCRHCPGGFTRISCSRCGIYLCLYKGKNCFMDFHKK